MKWTLFAKLEQAVARARRLGDQDRPALARLLVEHNPRLGLDPREVAGAGDAATIMAEVALDLLRILPKQIDEAAASIVDANPLAPAEALARVAALAYVALCDDLLPDDLPGGYGLIDDAISLRATGVGVFNGWGEAERDRRLTQLGVEARFLSLFLPRERLAEFGQALDQLFATIKAYKATPLPELKSTTRRLIEQPPKQLAELLLPIQCEDRGTITGARPKLFELCDATLEREAEALRFRFEDGIAIELCDGRLRLAA